jgi:EAL domain-containing protein (putative c-di-GMP-specific phosphodiesterase class I)
VFQTACKQLAQWRDRYPDRDLSMAINLSRRQFVDGDLVPMIGRTLTALQLPPHCVKLEVTESVIMDDDEAGRQVLKAIKRTGAKISMDDFGTGYSSLAFLHKFPIDVLKIDRSFVQNLRCKRDASAVVSAIVQLAHNLNMQVVAEGLETSDQAAFLQTVDCDYGQGYLFSPALEAVQAECWIESLDVGVAQAA